MTDSAPQTESRIGGVVLHYRNWPAVATTIRSLQAQTVPLSIVLVDNASGDGSVEAIRACFPDLRVVEASTNSGYAAGMNLGSTLVTGDEVLLVTHDVQLDPDAVARLHAHLNGTVGMVGPVLFYADDPERVFSSGGFVDPRGIVGHHQEVPTATRRVDWLDGACVLVRRESLVAVDGLDEGYFLYFEEVDLATRLRRSGWQVACAPDVRAWQQPSAVPVALFTRNWLRYLARNDPRRLPRAFGVTLVRMLRAARQRSFRRAALIGWGLIAFCVRLPPKLLTRT